mmetsp:Transcript_75405/g.243965  ORF Transcript_75405/g.243965 Transcript_75405/m.243965 type:complete len:241 (+) Transcript_75405:103-825(+)
MSVIWTGCRGAERCTRGVFILAHLRGSGAESGNTHRLCSHRHPGTLVSMAEGVIRQAASSSLRPCTCSGTTPATGRASARPSEGPPLAFPRGVCRASAAHQSLNLQADGPALEARFASLAQPGTHLAPVGHSERAARGEQRWELKPQRHLDGRLEVLSVQAQADCGGERPDEMQQLPAVSQVHGREHRADAGLLLAADGHARVDEAHQQAHGLVAAARDLDDLGDALAHGLRGEHGPQDL